MIWAARAHKSRRPTTADGAGAEAVRRQPSARARERLERSNRLERPGLLLHPSIRSQAPPWYTPSPAVAAAIDSFDARHQANAASAEFACRTLKEDQTNAKKAAAFFDGLNEVRWNRFHVDDDAAAAEVWEEAHERVAEKTAWSLETSIWAPRRLHCDARDFYDTEEVIRRVVVHPRDDLPRGAGLSLIHI